MTRYQSQLLRRSEVCRRILDLIRSRESITSREIGVELPDIPIRDRTNAVRSLREAGLIERLDRTSWRAVR